MIILDFVFTNFESFRFFIATFLRFCYVSFHVILMDINSAIIQIEFFMELIFLEKMVESGCFHVSLLLSLLLQLN